MTKACVICGNDRGQGKSYCATCSTAVFFVRKACSQVVLKAVSVGLLPLAKSLKCADCGNPAECYDHRDYNRPLDVEPVCIACNLKRGPAKPRTAPLFDGRTELNERDRFAQAKTAGALQADREDETRAAGGVA